MIEKTISRTRAVGAATLTATVSPCSCERRNSVRP